MNNQNKGGRPKKKIPEKRRYQVNFKLSIEERMLLKRKVKESGMPINDFIRECISDGVIISRLTVEQIADLKQLIGMANNLNQLAKKANSHGFESAHDECILLADRIDNLINQIQNDSKNNKRK